MAFARTDPPHPDHDEQLPFARQLEAQLREAGFRVTNDEQPDKMGAKIRRAQLEKVPYMLVIGKREAEAGQVAVRSRWKGDEGAMPFDAFLARAKAELATKALAPVA